MKRVFICRIADIPLRKHIERFLSDDYEIAGYVDYNYSEDVVFGRPFVALEDLCREEYEYIILAVRQEKSQREISEILIKHGVPEEKIVIPTAILHMDKEGNQLDLVAELDRSSGDEKGLIFGLSYSLRGIIKSKLRLPCYDFSWHGLDLYYNYRLYEYALGKGLFSGASTALLVFPYYFFNYDLSRSPYQYAKGLMFAVRGLEDWHNHKKVQGSRHYLASYHLFGEKIAREFSFERFQFQTMRSHPEHKDRLEHIWFTRNEETIMENQRLFEKFVRLLRKCGLRVCVVIPPVNVAVLDDESNAALEKKRVEFYDAIYACNQEKIEIFDCAVMFDTRPDLFYDFHHINYDGAVRFTQFINENILQS